MSLMSTGSNPQSAIVSLSFPRSHAPTVPPKIPSTLSRKEVTEDETDSYLDP